jgi:GTPase SAR1 family protein
MESLLKFLPHKSYNTFGLVFLTLFVSIGVVIIGIASDFESKTTLKCNPDEALASDLSTRKYIETRCYLKYVQEFYPTFPLYVLFVINFGLVLLLSFIYAYSVKHRVEIFANSPSGTATYAEHESQPLSGIISQAASDPMAHQSSTRHFVFTVYLSHLIICRILPLAVFASLLLNSANFPVKFHCHWPMNLMSFAHVNLTQTQSTNISIVECTYPMGKKNEKVSATVITINVLFSTEAFIELAFLLWSTCKDHSLMADMEFCCVYLLRKRNRITKLMKNVRKNVSHALFYLHEDFGEQRLTRRKLEEIYINLTIQEGRETTWSSRRKFQNRNETYEAHLKPPVNATTLTTTADLFKATGASENHPRTILVVGRPGIGKTLLTKKILHEWQQQSLEFWNGKIVILIRFRSFQQEKTSLREMLRHSDGLNMSSADFNCIYEYICLMPSNVVLIFDGLDELRFDNESITQERTVNGHNEVTHIFQIFKQLVESELLPGLTVLTTSRPTAEHIYTQLSFDREVEILGFREEQIKDYVEKFCRNDTGKAIKMWNFIKESPELLSLSYIPVNSYIICLTLIENIDVHQIEEDGSQTFQSNAPGTITELYKRAIKILLFRHHANYKDKPIPKDYIIAKLPGKFQKDLEKLKEIARNGMIQDQLIFEFESSDNYVADLSGSGIFNKLEDKRRNIFSFLHLTIQEFLAALHVVDDIDNVESFLIKHIDNPKWHFVIQFVAGLIGDKIRELKEERNTSQRFGQFLLYLTIIPILKDYKLCKVSHKSANE